jgi:hypothetical protein
MRGVVLKNHYDPTAGLAYLARKETLGLDVFGGIDLNLTVGGMNATAVERITQVAGGWGCRKLRRRAPSSSSSAVR